jgi:hypothetical protein
MVFYENIISDEAYDAKPTYGPGAIHTEGLSDLFVSWAKRVTLSQFTLQIH